MGRPGTAAVTTTERLAKISAETAGITVKGQGKLAAAVQTATAAGLVAAPVAGAVAGAKYSAYSEVEKAQEERKKLKEQGQGQP